MRNLELMNLLLTLSYDRGHHAGQEEVDQIFKEMARDFEEIDDMLPYTMPPKFKDGDKVHWVTGLTGTIVSCTLVENGYRYGIIVPEFTNIPLLAEEHELKLGN